MNPGLRLLLEKSWRAWRDDILAELGLAHPDLASKTTRIDIAHYDHAIPIPIPIPIPKTFDQISLQPSNNNRSALLKQEYL